jgi:IS1 family transposase
MGKQEEQDKAYIRLSLGKRDLKTAKKLSKKIKRLGISYERTATDDEDSFLVAFTEDNHNNRGE